MPIAVFVLGLSVFGLGTTEFMIAGLLPTLAGEFGTTIPAAGFLISVYAIGVMIGAPVITALVTRLPRKTVLLALLFLFLAGEILAAVAPTYGILVLARVLTALCHGAFFGIGAVVASDLAPPEKRGRAVAVMFGGLTVATVLGVPAGVFVAEQFGWRITFAAVAVIAVISIVGVATLVPAQPSPEGANVRRELTAFRKPTVWLALGTTMLSQGALYAAFTYAPTMLGEVTGFSPTVVAGLLVLFGAGTVAGATVGGRLADRSLMSTLCGGLIGLAVVLAIFTFTVYSSVAAIITLVVFGFAGFVINPALQTRVMNEAGEAPTLASAMNISAFNVGNAIGPWFGGLVISAGLGLTAPNWVGAILAVVALGVAMGSVAVDRRRRASTAEQVDAEQDVQPQDEERESIAQA